MIDTLIILCIYIGKAINRNLRVQRGEFEIPHNSSHSSYLQEKKVNEAKKNTNVHSFIIAFKC